MKIILSLLSLAIIIYVGLCIYLYVHQRSLLYFPTPETANPNAETISLKSGGEILKIWHLGPTGGDAIIYFGGNTEDVAQDIPFVKKTFPGRSVYLVNYRGYGGSSGTPSEEGLCLDATTVYDFVHAAHVKVSVIGRSLGSGVAIYLATARPVNKLVLATPYDSIMNVAKNQYPIFPIGLLLKDRFESSKRAASINIPVLVILAEQDQLVPHANSQALVAAFRSTTPQLVTVPGTNHNSIETADGYWHYLEKFLT